MSHTTRSTDTRIFFFRGLTVCFVFRGWLSEQARQAESKLLSAYISDSPSSSVPAWIAKETGLFKKYGLDIDLVFIDGSTRGDEESSCR